MGAAGSKAKQSRAGQKMRPKRRKHSSILSSQLRGGGRQGGSLANLRNLLEEAAQGVAVLVGECPHRVAEALQ